MLLTPAVDAYFHRDLDARWGYRDVDKPFFGYKLHILIDIKPELPIAFRVTPGNVHDSQEYLNLLEDVQQQTAVATVSALNPSYGAILQVIFIILGIVGIVAFFLTILAKFGIK